MIHQNPMYGNRTQPDTQKTITCGISKAFYNKSIRNGYDNRAYGDSFKATVLTVDDLTSHIVSGNAYTLASFKKGKRDKNSYQKSELLGLDLDDNVSVSDCLDNAFIRENAYLIHATASSGKLDDTGNPIHKTRVLFRLDRPITEMLTFERCQRALQLHCADLRPDPACKDASRLFYGADTNDYVTANHVLELDTVLAIVNQWQEVLDDTEPRTEVENIQIREYNRKALSDITDNHQKRYLKYARTALDNIASDLASTGKGGRNHALYKAGAKLGNMISASMIDHAEVETTLHNSALSCGLRTNEIQNTLPRAIRDGMQTPFDLSKLDRYTITSTFTPETAQISDLQPVNMATATKTINEQYITITDVSGLTFIKSGMGTNKTGAIRDYITPDMSVLILTHNRRLIDNIVNRYQHLGFINYQDKKPSDYKDCRRLIITPNSVHYLMDTDGNMPHFDLVVMDEPFGVLSALGSPTLFSDNLAMRAWTAISKVIRDTHDVVIMDAYLSQDIVYIFSHVRKTNEYTVIENLYKKDNGIATFHIDEGFCLQSAIRDAKQHNALLFVSCESKDIVKSVQSDLKRAGYSDDHIIIVTGDNNTDTTRDLLADINSKIDHKYAIVHTSSISSGFSVDVPAVHCGLFDGATTTGRAGLVANDFAQMIGRTRNKRALHVWIRDTQSDKYETNATAIYRQHRQDALANQKLIATVLDHAGTIQPYNYELLTIYAMLEASKNEQVSRPKQYLMAYLIHDGYTIEVTNGRDKETTDRLKTDKEQREAEFKDLVLNPDTEPISTHDLNTMKRNGDEITDVLKAGNLVYKIRNIIGNDCQLTEAHYEDLKDSKSRTAIYRHVNHFVDDKKLAFDDSNDIDKPLHLHKNSLLHKRFDMLLLQTVFKTTDKQRMRDITLPQYELNRRMSEFTALCLRDEYLSDMINRLVKKYDTHHNFLRALLRNIGLKLSSKQVRVNDANINEYGVNPDLCDSEYIRIYRFDTEIFDNQMEYVESRIKIQAEHELQLIGLC